MSAAKGVRVVLGVPTGGSVKVETMESIINCGPYGMFYKYLTESSIYIDRNRNRLVTTFLSLTKDDDDWLLMVDSDIQFEPWAVTKMLLIAADRGASVVFGDVGLGISVAATSAYRIVPGATGEEASRFVPWEDHPAGAFYSDAFATAFFAVKRWVWMKAGVAPFQVVHHDTGEFTGEDMYFSFVLRKLEIRPLCVTGLRLIHNRTAPVLAQTDIDELTAEMAKQKGVE